MFDPVRIGVVGLGNFGALHAQTLATLSEANLVALVDVDPRAFAKFDSDPLSKVATWNNLEEAMSAVNAEAWIVATSTSSHVTAANRILSNGGKVLVEKPIAASLTAAEALRPLVATDSSNFMAGHIVLFNSEFRQLAEESRSRGTIRFIDCVRHRPVSTMALLPDESPYHLTMVHDLYCVQSLMSRAEPIVFSTQSHHTPDGACDLALAQLQWSDGAIASLTASFMCPAGMASDGFDRLEVFGDGWAARTQPNPRPLELWDDRAIWPMALEIRAGGTNSTGMLAEELRCFCRVVRGIEPVPVGATFDDALQVLRWLDKFESAANSVGKGGNCC